MYDRCLAASVEAIVVALCLDYERRRKIIESRMATKRVDTEYRYYNFKIYDAAAEIVGEDLAAAYINDIGGRIG